MRVAALRRYPVKSMGGEPLSSVAADRRGLEGDRWYAVEDADGHFASGKSTRRFRRRDAVFDYAAATLPDGRVRVRSDDGEWVVGDPALDEELSTAMGTPVAVTAEGEVSHQDMGAVSLVSTASLAWCADRWGVAADVRRLRANVLVEADEPFVEESWQGAVIAVGEVTLRVVQRAPRCRMIDIAQDGVRPADRWLKPLAAEREMFLAVYADVVVPGTIRVGDRVMDS